MISCKSCRHKKHHFLRICFFCLWIWMNCLLFLFQKFSFHQLICEQWLREHWRDTRRVGQGRRDGGANQLIPAQADPALFPTQSSNQLSGLPAIGQWSYTEGQSQLTQTPNPVGALTSPCQSGVELMRVVLCFRHHMDASHGATAVTGQLNYESDQSQPKYINQTWNQVHISIRNRKTFTQHEWCIHKTESQSDPNGLNTFNTIEHFRMLSSMCVAFYFSKNDVGNQQFTAETVWPFKPRIQSANVEHRKSSLLCNQPYFVICVCPANKTMLYECFADVPS